MILHSQRVIRHAWLAMILGCQALIVPSAKAQVPALPDGAHAHWIVEQPEEIVEWVAFDPALVAHEIPSGFRFVTVGELAGAGRGWAADFLQRYPGRGQWGVSFLEIVRARTFTIDGRSPAWPEHGAVGLWFARVAVSDPEQGPGAGQPFLALGFWIPDRAYVDYMREGGYPASYGSVRLFKDAEGNWKGSVNADGVSILAECAPTGPEAGRAGSAGMQVFIPPRSTGLSDVVRVAFAGHRSRVCAGDSAWPIRGHHPLHSSVPLGPAELQFGYRLVGGTHARQAGGAHGQGEGRTH